VERHGSGQAFLVTRRQHRLSFAILCDRLKNLRRPRVEGTLFHPPVELTDKLLRQNGKRLPVKVESRPAVVFRNGKVKDLPIPLFVHDRQATAVQHCVGDLQGKPQIVEEGTVPVPEYIAVFVQ
jgi:hypothetical protein